ncbi:MAG: TrkA C-terminal domain-containing protein [Tenuifilaceae bacterium]|jgi:putative transport protein|nr:TrkA C-terminal domain-containing protein [Bacteroidales bacterium]MDI9516331.1 TrkA C-terminal domain-containing protein [Bacteroidota bacterium]NLH57126.1 transporter [Rikenellaceae bacterium]OQC61572.1 MAG: Aspartate/alanine antiporter [Bacteroidetes bacterium ADurb.Bin008]HNV81443.1 TrkA C-terminal domain-containing protein [Tenuifilaceae bacterium]
MDIISNPIFALFVIITLGFMVGNIRIKGVSFDVSAVIFVALIFGHFGVTIPPEIERMGMVLFIFTVGIQAGPGFLDSFRTHGRMLALIALVIVLSAFIITYGALLIFRLEPPVAIGLLCGALTSTPGLSVAIDVTSSPLASIGYGIAYPFGVIGVILFVKLFPKIGRFNLEIENEKVEQLERGSHATIGNAHFRVDNASVFGKSLSELKIRAMTEATISRIQHGDICKIPTPDTILHEGDIIKAVGTHEALEKVRVLIGAEVNTEIQFGEDYTVEQILVTNKKLVNKKLATLSLLQNYNAVITRIRRSGIDISPSPDLPILFGDKLTVACPKNDLKALSTFMGNNDKILSDTDFFPIALGITLGILLGQLQISVANSFTFGFGLSGGILIMAIVLGGIGKTGPIMWSMSGAANQLLRQLGLLFFLAGVGTHAGVHLVETLTNSGATLFTIGIAITLIPMIITALLNKFFFKLDLFEFLGAISGGMTSTPGLAACDSLTRSNAPGKAYAAVYPIAMVILIVFVQILSRLS